LTETRLALRATICITLASTFSAPAATSQVYSGVGNLHEVFVGSETETYLRYLDLSDTGSSASWVIRPLSPSQVRALANAVAAHPWQSRLRAVTSFSSAVEAGLLSPNASVRFNSSFPYGSNDGPIWAGRGATLAVQAGVYAQLGPLSISVLPTAFVAANSPFLLASSTLPCQCGDPMSVGVDRPQRFGTGAYGQFDPGQSSIRFDAFAVDAGFATANEGWGPSVEYPFTLGNNAAGFPHFFLGSASPFNIFIGHAHLKVVYGRLDQSSYSPVTGSKFYSSRLEPGRVRFASGLTATFQPRGFNGLEIGGARFIHSVWPRSGIPASYIRKPFRAFLKAGNLGGDQQLAGTDNQVASIFARWAFRQSGLEVYGEYGREDNSYDLRDLTQEPDHQRTYSLGLAKVFSTRASNFNVVRIELMNFQLPPLATTGRGEGDIFIHSPLRQGHTNRGQLLGADIGVAAAAGSTVRFDHYSSGGRWAVFWRRDLRKETNDSSLTAPSIPQRSDVLHAFGFERITFTRHFDLTTSLNVMRDFSRDFAESRSNINLVVALTLPR
jgi:hypothetical protein